MEFSLNEGTPFAFEGVHSGGQLSGIEVTLTVYSDDDAQALDELFKKKTAMVDDAFANRRYEATLHMKSSTYQEGRPGKTYRFEVKELDEAPQFERLEIEGHTFQVIRNAESLHEDKRDLSEHIATFVAKGISDISKLAKAWAHHDPKNRHR